MNREKINKENCRICLDENAEKDWNDRIRDQDCLTYRDCYYKYTKLDTIDEEHLNLTTTICHSCSDNLKNIDEFVSKAIEIHKLLQDSIALRSKHDDEEYETNFETILIPENGIKPEAQELYGYNDSSEVSMYDSTEENNVWTEAETSASMKKTKEDEMESTKNPENKEQIEVKKKPKRGWNSWKPWIIPTCCSICSKVCNSKYKVIQHEKTHIKDRERTETCEECGMKFFDKTCLRSHMKTHAKDREKTKKCEFCNKAFYENGALNIHRRIHLGQMIKCTLCTKEYCRQVDLDKHMVSHSTTRISSDLKTQKKYYVCCEFCGENIRTPSYKSHIARHNNEPLAKCAICNKEFFSKKSCIKHLKSVHHKEKKEERNELVIAYRTTHFSNLYLQQKAPKLFIKE